MKKIVLMLVFINGLGQVFGQNRTCGTMHHHQFLKASKANYESDFNAYKNVIKDYIKEKSNSNAVSRVSPNAIVTIPVVVHIVYKTAEQNITDAQAISQVQVLNDDFAKLNADRIKVTQPLFAAVAGGTQIRFALAVRTPNGVATNGITRTVTTQTSFIDDDNVKHTATGGKDAWDVTKYINIWVCNLGSRLLGYGEFPTTSLSNTYGLVLNYWATGSGGSAISPFNLGRTGTHEFGHCFDLFHIWGNDTGTPDECAGTDNCADTPNQQVASGGAYVAGSMHYDACNTTGNGYMWMNYMDYTDDDSMYMFTNEQVGYMEAVVNTAPWNILKTSDGLTPLGTENFNLLNDLKIYPNPTHDILTINMTVLPDNYQIINTIGQVILTQNIATQNDLVINTTPLSNGIYFIKIQKNSVTKTIKFIKQ